MAKKQLTQDEALLVLLKALPARQLLAMPGLRDELLWSYKHLIPRIEKGELTIVELKELFER